MSIFSNKITTYNGSWTALEGTQKLSAQEVSSVDKAEVVESKFGLSICFHLKSGQLRFIPITRDSQLAEGEVVNPADVEITTLQRVGSEDIYKADVA